GDDATQRLTELLYPELKRIARGLMRRERAGHTLQPTAVLHEAFVRLVGQAPEDWHDRAHFLGFATRLMRQVLVDHARRHQAAKRGAAGVRVTLDEDLMGGREPSFDILDLDRALERYAALDPRGAQVAALRVFGGLTVQEAAACLDVSPRTVNGDWAVARLWLARELSAPVGAAAPEPDA
ncbi:MAG: ECF-type sigma factor, partial [Acidobacteriota bacterium]|nr:ECF-type sigma factor [Acidobacteriota bacterium]